MLKTYVELDIWASPSREVEVNSMNPSDLELSLVDTVRFRFFNRDTKQSKGDKMNCTMWYYVGERLTPTDVRHRYPQATELLTRMKKTNCDAVLIREVLFPLNPGDSVFSPK